MAITGKGAEGIDLAARAMAWADAVDRRAAASRRANDDPADADEQVPEPRDPLIARPQR